MKKFIITIASYFLIMGIIVSLINVAYISQEASDVYDTKRYKNMPYGIEVCNLGSSHGVYAFSYDEKPELSTFNFAFTAQTLSYDLRILQHYQDHLAEGCVVFIPVSYFSFFGQDEITEPGFLSKNERYYQILPRKLIKEYSFMTYLYTVVMPAVGAGTNIVKVFFGRQQEEPDRAADMLDVKQYAAAAYDRHLGEHRRDRERNLLIVEEEVQALYDIIALCKKIGAVPIMVTTPYLAEYTDTVMELSPEFFPYFYSIVNKISQDTGTPYLNYAFDERFRNDYNLFLDSDHMNKRGAHLFTGILLDEVLGDVP